MRKIPRWGVGILALFLVLGGVLVLSKDALLKSLAERRIRQETGLPVTLGQFRAGLISASLHIQDFKLFNSPEFGGAVLVDLPELYLEVDPARMASGKLHFKVVRLHLRELNLIRNKDGRLNVEALSGGVTGASQDLPQDSAPLESPKPKPPKSNDVPGASNVPPPSLDTPEPPRSKGVPQPSQPPAPSPKQRAGTFEFAGIDQLHVTLDKLNYQDWKHPASSRQIDLGLHDEVVTNLATQAELERWSKAILIRILVREYLQNPQRAKQQGLDLLLDAWK